MFYLIRGETERASAETFDRAALLVVRGWELTTRAEHRRRWQTADGGRAALPQEDEWEVRVLRTLIESTREIERKV